MLIWNEHDRELHEASSIHQAPVRVIQWSNNGNRLVTSDEVSEAIIISTFTFFLLFFTHFSWQLFGELI